MARQMKAGNGHDDKRRAPNARETAASPTTASNSAQRKAIMREVHEKLVSCEARIAEIREEMAEQKGRVKGLDIRMIDFQAARRLIALEGDDRSKALDSFRESYAALSVGEQLDWLDATTNTPAAETVSVKTARSAGREAGRAGKPGRAPHAEDRDLGQAWMAGWMEGTSENAPAAAA